MGGGASPSVQRAGVASGPAARDPGLEPCDTCVKLEPNAQHPPGCFFDPEFGVLCYTHWLWTPHAQSISIARSLSVLEIDEG